MERTWKPTAAGILNIIAGVVGLVGAYALIATASYELEFYVLREVAMTVGLVGGIILAAIVGGNPIGLEMIYMGAGVLFSIFGIVAIIGGVYSRRRRLWRLALAGSITALICESLLGIPAIIFIAQSKKEFT